MAVILVSLPLSAGAEPLVRVDALGRPVAAVSDSWRELAADRVLFHVPRKRLASVMGALEKAFEGKSAKVEKLTTEELVIAGVPLEDLYRKLAFIDLPEGKGTGEEDPLTAIGEVPEKATLQAPDGGSSLRMGVPADRERRFRRRFEARVERIYRTRYFPFAEALIAITAPPDLRHPRYPVEKGQTLRVRPFYQYKSTKDFKSFENLDLQSPETRRNIGVWFLKEGDIVTGRIAEKRDSVTHVLYLERKWE